MPNAEREAGAWTAGMHAQIAATTVHCEGWVVLSTVVDNDGHKTFQHSPIYRSQGEAESQAANVRPLHSFERSITRTVRMVCTAFPLRDVLAGKATRWNDDPTPAQGADIRRVA